MKVSLSTLSNSLQSLIDLNEETFPAKVKYRLGRVLVSAQAEIETLRKAHLELLKSHGAEEKEGQFVLPPENLKAFQPEFESLLAEEVEVWGQPISVELFGDVAIDANIAPLTTWLLTDGTEAATPLKAVAAASGD